VLPVEHVTLPVCTDLSVFRDKALYLLRHLILRGLIDFAPRRNTIEEVLQGVRFILVECSRWSFQYSSWPTRIDVLLSSPNADTILYVPRKIVCELQFKLRPSWRQRNPSKLVFNLL
jgi:hypothetical protein